MLRNMDGWQLSGTRYGDGMPGVLKWDGTRLSGDVDSIRAADAYVRDHDGILAVTPTGPFWRYDATDKAHAWVLAVLVLGSAGTTEGEPPELDIPPVPDGAIP